MENKPMLIQLEYQTKKVIQAIHLTEATMLYDLFRRGQLPDITDAQRSSLLQDYVLRSAAQLTGADPDELKPLFDGVPLRVEGYFNE
jgi:hypothetical protein